MKTKLLLVTAVLLLSLASCDAAQTANMPKCENTDSETTASKNESKKEAFVNGAHDESATASDPASLPEVNIPNIDDVAVNIPDTDKGKYELLIEHNLSWVDWLNRELIGDISENGSGVPAILIESTEELEEFLKATENSIDLSSKHDELVCFEDAGDFDKKYFEKYSLLIVYSGEHSGSVRHKITGISCENNTLSVDIENYYPSDVATKDLTGRLLLFTLEKDMTEGCTDIDIDINFDIYMKPENETAVDPVDIMR